MRDFEVEGKLRGESAEERAARRDQQERPYKRATRSGRETLAPLAFHRPEFD